MSVCAKLESEKKKKRRLQPDDFPLTHFRDSPRPTATLAGAQGSPSPVLRTDHTLCSAHTPMSDPYADHSDGEGEAGSPAPASAAVSAAPPARGLAAPQASAGSDGLPQVRKTGRSMCWVWRMAPQPRSRGRGGGVKQEKGNQRLRRRLDMRHLSRASSRSSLHSQAAIAAAATAGVALVTLLLRRLWKKGGGSAQARPAPAPATPSARRTASGRPRRAAAAGGAGGGGAGSPASTTRPLRRKRSEGGPSR